jgi:hypothetical protein
MRNIKRRRGSGWSIEGAEVLLGHPDSRTSGVQP